MIVLFKPSFLGIFSPAIFDYQRVIPNGLVLCSFKGTLTPMQDLLETVAGPGVETTFNCQDSLTAVNEYGNCNGKLVGGDWNIV